MSVCKRGLRGLGPCCEHIGLSLLFGGIMKLEEEVDDGRVGRTWYSTELGLL